MLQLNKIAAERARRMVAENFRDPSSLDDIAVLDMQLEKQLVGIEAQLNSAVQGKLDSLKRAVDLMDESVAKLNKIATNITSIDEKIARTNTQISNFQYLKKAHNARDNLMKVINQVQFFGEVPAKVAALKQQLLDNPGTLKEVFLESVKLESLRASLIKEMDSADRGGRRKSITSANAEADDPTRAKVEDNLRQVPELVLMVQQFVFSNINTMFDLANNSPEDLVATFEVIEMQQEYNNRRNQAIAMRQMQQQQQSQRKTLPGEIQMYPNIISEIQSRIKQLLDSMVDEEFGNWQQYEEEAAERLHRLAEKSDRAGVAPPVVSAANGLRIVGTRLLQRMEECQTLVTPCLPRHYDIMYLFCESFEKRLVPALSSICSGERLQALNVSDILDMISWFEYLSSSIVNFGFPDRPSLKKYASLREELLFDYKERIKKQVRTWFDNIKQRALEITQHAQEGILLTSQPEDMFNIIHAQVAVAREKLPLEYVHEVAIACMQVLQEMQRHDVEQLASKLLAREIDPETLCAIINDNANMYEKCREFSDSVSKMLRDRENEQKILEDIAEEVAYQYSRTASTAVETLGRCVLDVLDEEIFQSQLFSFDWEEGRTNLMATVTATLDDYYADLTTWLSYYYYSKLVRFMLGLVVGRYVMTIRRKVRVEGMSDAAVAAAAAAAAAVASSSNSASAAQAVAALGSITFAFRNEVRASNVIVQDHKVLREYYEKHLEVLKHGGLRKVVPEGAKSPAVSAESAGGSEDPTLELLLQEMEPIHQLSVVISCRSLPHAEPSARAFFKRYGIDGLRAIQACFLCNPQLGKVDKVNVCSAAQKLFESLAEKEKYSTSIAEDFLGYDQGLDYYLQNQSGGSGGAAARAKSRGGFSAFFGRRR